ncbi:MAG: YggS family pyridoxal phosphate-dependent enzyme [Rhodocyclaceae bacterium]|nr:YggS family pyridoxal phosphate-dependent enzyme [Rhodocyclaceae bacterium]
MTTISENLQGIHQRIRHACATAGRDPSGVTLLAVSKSWPVPALAEAAVCGQRAFGESYVQEGLIKINALASLGLEWHFIGPIQSNKTRLIAENFAWVHSVDRFKIAERLSAQRPPHLPPLQICLQVNVSGEKSKAGCLPEEAAPLCHALLQLPHLTLRGLMTIPEPTEDVLRQRLQFARLRECRDRINTEIMDRPLDTLSMGMSHDLDAAILEGATLVRIGTAIFGTRTRMVTKPAPHDET